MCVFQGHEDTIKNDGLTIIFLNQSLPPATFYYSFVYMNALEIIWFERCFLWSDVFQSFLITLWMNWLWRVPAEVQAYIWVKTTLPYISPPFRNNVSTDYLLSSNFSHLTFQLKLNLACPEVKPLIPLLVRDSLLQCCYVRTACLHNICCWLISNVTMLSEKGHLQS